MRLSPVVGQVLMFIDELEQLRFFRVNEQKFWYEVHRFIVLSSLVETSPYAFPVSI